MSTVVIKKDGQAFDLPKDFSIEIEETSPIFHTQGSHSASVKLPPSPNNRALLGYMHRLDARELPAQDSDVTVRDGAVIRTGKLNVTSAHVEEGYEANIGFTEGRAYNMFNSVKLSELSELPIYKSDGGLNELITHLNAVRKGTISADYALFPICVANEEKEDTDDDGVESKTTYSEYLNEVDDSGDLLSDSRIVQYLINGEVTSVTIPKGYGITPFIRVHVLLNLIFKSYGYKIAENPFSEHYQLRELVILNNVADTIVRGEINYANLMPHCTINEFLDSLYCRFGMVYFVDETLSVHIKFLRDILRDNPQADLSNKRAGSYPIKYTSASRATLHCNTGLAGASTSADTYDSFLKQYHYTFSSIQGTQNTLYYDQERGQFMRRKGEEYEIITPDTFGWDRGEVIDAVDITSVDEAITYLSDAKHREMLMPSYITGSVKKHTVITSSSVDLSEGSIPSTPLSYMFNYKDNKGCIGLTHITTSTGDIKTMNVSGVQLPLVYALTFVGEHGHFMQFWREYDGVLRHSNHTVEVDLNLTAVEISVLDKWKPVALSGQPLLIESMRYESPRTALPVDTVLRTVRLYHPYDLDKEQIIATAEQVYYWRVDNTMMQVVRGYEIEIRILTENSLQEGWEISHLDTTTDIGEQNIFDEDDALLIEPPTEEEYLAGEVRLIQTTSVVINIEVVAMKHDPSTNRPEYMTYTYAENREFTVSIVADIVGG
ncbi:MAG: hypothetical protein ACRC3Z_11220 [Phocaeicola sp.]